MLTHIGEYGLKQKIFCVAFRGKTVKYIMIFVTRYVRMSQMSPNALLSNGQFNMEKKPEKKQTNKQFFYFLRSVFAWLTFRTLTFKQ